MASKKPYIHLENVSLDLPVRHSGVWGKLSTAQALVGARITKGAGKASIAALDNISLHIRDGEQVAIIGRNGSGKTTLLRLLAGIYHASSGHMEVQGRVTCLFSSGLGLRNEATGWENIRFASMLYDVPLKDIPALAEEIADFSELGNYLDLPISAYSTGMRTRLGFSIVSSLKPEILLIDEVFGAGDPEFQKKARKRVEGMLKQSRIFVLASQNLGLIRKFCTKAIWLDRGVLRMSGKLKDVLAAKAELEGPTDTSLQIEDSLDE
ncbi:ABC-type polysaccharide/polyol phosphate transport system, ATPase component [Glycocaulis alkaliphilus]|uniref:ABC-type polysaccharide/polyol phosphate transport system, ATPase component n=1 Tax=Glycocaulis alkaliphilus TaxID=1434191 RepID=A0A3T0EB85_9PROT|nr:ABC transporter ATP-binding protein [Glycocaulis alkaliphilus]AZU04681.1 ABC-type polysaccharide/polyol phosphate transport system, ATPase component [Glycocaulis alkaliphilus]GGB68569.1 sugar ABC transporter ATP-binding protein [Glycocaulis alkaliphilus]